MNEIAITCKNCNMNTQISRKDQRFLILWLLSQLISKKEIKKMYPKNYWLSLLLLLILPFFYSFNSDNAFLTKYYLYSIRTNKIIQVKSFDLKAKKIYIINSYFKFKQVDRHIYTIIYFHKADNKKLIMEKILSVLRGY